MAKKKGEPAAPKVASADDRVMIAQIKGPADFREWATEAADFARSSLVTLFEVALVEKMERMGFQKPAPKRKGSR